MGLGITLKVMAGDKIDVFGKSYYFQNTSGTSGNSAVPVIDLLNAFLGSPASVGTVHGVTSTAINVPAGLTGINSMVTQQTTQSNASPNKPRAFINVVFFDEQFRTYTGGFAISMVGSNSVAKDHYSELQNLTAGKSGYVYIYCSNESPVNVFFDNLQVVHTRSALMEETHYYPFGLVMSGISSKAAGGMDNKKKYNGYELTTDFDVNINESFYRSHDPQLGRFWQLDPKPDEKTSLYSAMGNNPILQKDPLGDTIVAPIIISQKLMPDVYQNHLNYIKKHPDEALTIFGLTFLVFNYEPDKDKQDQNRAENKKANPVNNKDPKKEEDEVAPAATKEGGARGVRMAVPKTQNRSHGGQVGAAIKWLRFKDGDKFLTILIPDNSQNSKPQTQAAPVESPTPVLEKILNRLDKLAPKIPFIPIPESLTPSRTAPGLM